MGDSGSTFIAFVLAWFGVSLLQSDTTVLYPVTVLWVFAFPLFDLTAVCLYRLQQGRSVFGASRDHIHHLLNQLGMTVQHATFLLCGVSFVLGIIGVLLNDYGIAEYVQFIAIIGVLILYLLCVKMMRMRIAKQKG